MNELRVKPIGTIRTPYRRHEEIPIQGRFKPDVGAWLELYGEYAEGLKDLEGFSHAILLYHFHCSNRVTMSGRPFLEDEAHGIFAIRGPHRPNHIGLSVVRIERIEARRLWFTYVDMLDGTPLLDIKPYVTHFDCFDDARCGWIDKHFADGGVPQRARQKRKHRDQGG